MKKIPAEGLPLHKYFPDIEPLYTIRKDGTVLKLNDSGDLVEARPFWIKRKSQYDGTAAVKVYKRSGSYSTITVGKAVLTVYGPKPKPGQLAFKISGEKEDLHYKNFRWGKPRIRRVCPHCGISYELAKGHER